jgi:hypothetical protein
MAALATAGITVASCTGASTTPPGPSPAPTVTASIVPQTLLPTTAGTLTLPAAANGQAASVTVAAGAPGNTIVDATSSTTAPGTAPAPSSTKRSTASIFGAVPFFWVTFTVTQAVPAGIITGESVTLSGQPPNTSYYTEIDDVTTAPAVKLATAGPGTVTGSTAAISGAGPALAPGHTYLLQFYYISLATTPSPVPSATATPAPAPSATPTGATPVPTAMPTAGPTATPVPAPTGSATPPPTYTFSGSSATAACTTASCGALNLAAGTLTVQFGAGSVAATLSASTASTMAQISPTGFPFILSNATVEDYVAVSSSVPVSFTQTPAVTISSLTGVTSCLLEAYVDQGSAYGWIQVAPATGGAPVSAGTATIAPVTITGSTVNLQVAPPFYGAVLCQ